MADEYRFRPCDEAQAERIAGSVSALSNAARPQGNSEGVTAVLERVDIGATAKSTITPTRSLSGHLHGIDEEGRVLFRAEGSAQTPVPVAIGLAISDGALAKAARLGQRALVVLTDDPAPRWVLVGLVRERVGAAARDARPGELEVRVDGETLRLSAERQIELRCGKSSLLLRHDGRVVLSGNYVVSASRGPMKIKGATIALN